MQTNQDLLRHYIEVGLQAHEQGDLNSAVASYRQALDIAPENPEVLNLFGAGLLQLGQPEEAIAHLRQAANRLRSHPGVLGNLAQALFALGRFDEARETFRKASRVDPRNAQFQLGIATSLAMQGKLAEAETLLRNQAGRFPNEPLVWFNLGNAVRDQGRPAEAIDLYHRAVELDPNLIDARNNLGGVLHARKRFKEAEHEYRACVEMAPNYVLAQLNLASVVIDLGRFREAEEWCREIIRRYPEIAPAYTYLGAAVGHQGRLLEAAEYHRAAARLAPRDAKIAEIYASALAETGRINEGLRRFSRALALTPDSVPVHQLLGNVLLSDGCLADGWAEYGYRPAFAQFRQVHPEVAISRALPPDLRGKELCVLREQGLGDELFFLRYAAPLSAMGAHVSYYASNKIASLLSRVACLERVLDETAAFPADKTAILAGDLPHALATRPASSLPGPPVVPDGFHSRDYPRRMSVFWPAVPESLKLRPLGEKIEGVQIRLLKAGPPPYLGLTWRGGIPPAEQHGASWSLYKEIGIPSFAVALKHFGGTVLSLQRRPAAGECGAFSGALGRPVHNFSDLNEDLEGMLALLSLIQEYVGVSNTNMHLRAAVGRTARVLVPCPAEWRWMHSGRSSPWFPGFSIYRQSLDGDWGPALAALARDLADTAAD